MNLSQADLAEKIGVSPTFISDLEQARRWVSAKTLSALASSLEAKPFRFFLPEDYAPADNSTIKGFMNDVKNFLSNVELKYNDDFSKIDK